MDAATRLMPSAVAVAIDRIACACPSAACSARAASSVRIASALAFAASISASCRPPIRRASARSDLSRSEAIFKCSDEIDRLESDADRVMRSAVSKLFREESDLKQVMKLRVIYDLLESITDRCEDVANIVEGIILENS